MGEQGSRLTVSSSKPADTELLHDALEYVRRAAEHKGKCHLHWLDARIAASQSILGCRISRKRSKSSVSASSDVDDY